MWHSHCGSPTLIGARWVVLSGTCLQKGAKLCRAAGSSFSWYISHWCHSVILHASAAGGRPLAAANGAGGYDWIVPDKTKKEHISMALPFLQRLQTLDQPRMPGWVTPPPKWSYGIVLADRDLDWWSLGLHQVSSKFKYYRRVFCLDYCCQDLQVSVDVARREQSTAHNARTSRVWRSTSYRAGLIAPVRARGELINIYSNINDANRWLLRYSIFRTPLARLRWFSSTCNKQCRWSCPVHHAVCHVISMVHEMR